MLAPLIHEVLAHSYEQKDKEIFARRIRERAEKYNIQNPRAIADNAGTGIGSQVNYQLLGDTDVND